MRPITLISNVCYITLLPIYDYFIYLNVFYFTRYTVVKRKYSDHTKIYFQFFFWKYPQSPLNPKNRVPGPATVPSLVLDPSVYLFSVFKGRSLSTSVLHFFRVLNTLTQRPKTGELTYTQPLEKLVNN